MDLGKSNATQKLTAGREIELKNPLSGKGLGLYVRVMGYDTPAVKNAARDAMRDLRKTATDADEFELLNVSRVVRAQTACIGYRGGSGSVSTLDEFRDFLDTHEDADFFIEQIEEAGTPRAPFSKQPKSKRSSGPDKRDS